MYVLFKIPINPRSLPSNWILAMVLLQLTLTVVAECSAASFLHKLLLAAPSPAQIESSL
jgi:hypothetical protein